MIHASGADARNWPAVMLRTAGDRSTGEEALALLEPRQREVVELTYFEV